MENKTIHCEVGEKQIASFLRNLFNLQVEYENNNFYAKNDTIIALVVSPHEGTDNKWMLRMTPRASFDRWANSRQIEEFFDTAERLNQYLAKNRLNIYKTLLTQLSEDYKELDSEYKCLLDVC